ncbi:histidine kinase [Natrinema sp. CBA1119]|uniref:histidine kinase n=1 Tax=Natrinema sp. CBA1119 TaxID=1608465 RepID=UPI001145899F|nr:histidine kinase [Natrinema sp. CBA1119]
MTSDEKFDALSPFAEMNGLSELVAATNGFEDLAAQTNGIAELATATNGFEDLAAQTNGIAELATATNGFEDLTTQTHGIADLVTATNGFQDLAIQTNGIAELAAATNGFEDLTTETRGIADLVAATNGFEDLAVQTNGIAELAAATNGFENLATQTHGIADLVAATNGFEDLAAQTNGIAELAAATNGFEDLTTPIHGIADLVAATNRFEDLVIASEVFEDVSVDQHEIDNREQIVFETAKNFSAEILKDTDSNESEPIYNHVDPSAFIFEGTIDPYGPFRDDIHRTKSLAVRVVTAAAFDNGRLANSMSEEEKKGIRLGIAMTAGTSIATPLIPALGTASALTFAVALAAFFSKQLEDFYNIKRRQRLPEEDQ